MQSDVFTPIINKFNDLIDSLIKDYEEFNLDKDTLGFLATKTRNFINFNKLTLNNVIFATLEKFEVDGYDFNSIASESKEFMNSIFDKMAESVDNILHEDDNQEHHHDHGHDHQRPDQHGVSGGHAGAGPGDLFYHDPHPSRVPPCVPDL